MIKYSTAINIISKVIYSFSSSSLTAVSPIDGRYSNAVKQLQNYFSQMALMKYRTHVQAKWTIHLMKKGIIKLPNSNNNQNISQSQINQLQKTFHSIVQNFNIQNAQRVKKIEKTTNHDLKSVQYFMKQELVKRNLGKYQECIHFCCTSQDINNLSYALMLKQGLHHVVIPKIQNIAVQLIVKSQAWSSHAMVARTHGQSASPTTMGKQYANFAYRINKQLSHLKKIQICGKINGAVGNYNAHYFVFPNENWSKINKQFVEKQLNLQFNPYTTQIQSHDSLARVFGELALANTIMIGLCRDTWQYISKGYLRQKTIQGEVGSSTMPHKVNPIDFQNAEGNLGVANSIAQHFRQKLPISRQQRDLSDSTVLRNQGSALGYSMIAYKSLLKGLSKIDSNRKAMRDELAHHDQVITQAIQTQLRKVNYPQPYQLLKKLSRGKAFTKESQQLLVKELQGKIPKQSLDKIKNLKPEQYLGIAQRLAQQVQKQCSKFV